MSAPIPPPPEPGLGAALRALRVRVDATRGTDLSAPEMSELNVIAFGTARARDRRATAQRVALAASRVRERSLIASMSAPGAEVEPWSGVIGAEGQLTGDGRIIEYGALTWATFPLPLRYVAADHGGHDGAVLVGRIDRVERGDDGLIRAWGVFDLGSEIGREAARLVGAGMLTGVSMDLDGTTAVPATMAGQSASLVSAGRVRAATLVSIPAFDIARIALGDCGCETPTAPGLYAFTPPAPPRQEKTR
jgi:hypothetical protein